MIDQLKEEVRFLREALQEIRKINNLRYEPYYPSRAEDVADSMDSVAEDALSRGK